VHAQLTVLGPRVVEAMKRTPDFLFLVMNEFAHELGAYRERALLLVDRLTNEHSPQRFDATLTALLSVLEASPRSTSGSTEAERARIPPLWRAFVTQHLSEIAAGKRILMSAPGVTPALLPAGWRLGDDDNHEWPASQLPPAP